MAHNATPEVVAEEDGLTDAERLEQAARHDPYDSMPRDVDLREVFDWEVVNAEDVEMSWAESFIGGDVANIVTHTRPEGTDEELIERAVDSASGPLGTQILRVVDNHKKVSKENADPVFADRIVVVRKRSGIVAKAVYDE